MRLGEKLKKTREEQGLEVKTLSESTRIPEKYLLAIENGNFCFLPKAKAHRLAYIREYAHTLHLDAEDCLKQFEQEDGFEDTITSHPKQSIKMLPFASISTFLRNTVLIGFVVFFAGYLVWQVKGILEPPYLEVYSPTEGYVASKPKTLIQGETEKESKLSINGQDIMVNEKGKFSAEIDLSGGVNTVVITATKKHGKTTVITRHIVVKFPATQPISLK